MKLALAILVGWNLVVFLAYGWDKRRAIRGGRRVPEAWLLGLSLPLASPGAWVGVRFFRHKSKKWSYLVKLLLVTALNVALVAAWLRFRGE